MLIGRPYPKPQLDTQKWRRWGEARAPSAESPYAAAFFTLVEKFGVVESPSRG
jgi:hypothetical protein